MFMGLVFGPAMFGLGGAAMEQLGEGVGELGEGLGELGNGLGDFFDF